MNKEIIFATSNAHKIEEIKSIYQDLGYEILSMKDAGISIDIEENGTTFEENAMIKAKAIADIIDRDAIVMADDSGLEIDYLGGEPGIYSARYLGEDTSYDYKNAEILKRLDGIKKEDRTARFVCAIAAVFPDGRSECVRGTIEGYIGPEPVGENGFGYDPIFYTDELKTSTANIPAEEKNKISHRGRALEAMALKL